MNAFISDIILALADSIYLTVLAKASIIMLLGLGVALAARKAPASWRYLTLAATLAVAIALPAVAFFSAGIAIEVPLATDPRPSAFLPSDGLSAQAQALPVTGSAVAERASGIEISLSTVLLAGWLTGAAIIGLMLTLELFRLRRLRRDGIPSLQLDALVRTINGGSNSVRVLLHEKVESPFTFGSFRPVIMLPPDAEAWDEDDLCRAIIHELEHVRRGDWAARLAARTVCAFYWFHPLVWAVWRKFCLEAERACDDAVVQRYGKADYAEQLVGLSRHISGRGLSTVVAMAKRSDLSFRVSAILDERQRRGPAGILATACVAIVGGFILVGVGSLQAVAQTGATKSLEVSSLSKDDDDDDIGSPADRALFKASESGNVAAMRKQIEAGANVNVAFDGDGTPLIAAAREGHIDAVMLLLEYKADLELSVPGDGNPLIMAAREGHLDIVRLLIERGADVNKMIPDDENALIQASAEGRLEVVKLLIKSGADVNARVEVERFGNPTTTEIRSPLFMARKGGHKAVAAYLAAAGARE